eukprot:1173582-Prorocentrum_minimum.AAC.1
MRSTPRLGEDPGRGGPLGEKPAAGFSEARGRPGAEGRGEKPAAGFSEARGRPGARKAGARNQRRVSVRLGEDPERGRQGRETRGGGRPGARKAGARNQRRVSVRRVPLYQTATLVTNHPPLVILGLDTDIWRPDQEFCWRVEFSSDETA